MASRYTFAPEITFICIFILNEIYHHLAQVGTSFGNRQHLVINKKTSITIDSQSKFKTLSGAVRG